MRRNKRQGHRDGTKNFFTDDNVQDDPCFICDLYVIVYPPLTLLLSFFFFPSLDLDLTLMRVFEWTVVIVDTERSIELCIYIPSEKFLGKTLLNRPKRKKSSGKNYLVLIIFSFIRTGN